MTFGWQEEDEPARKKPGKREKQALFAEQKGRCMYCAIRLPIEHFHVDHKTPFSRNGSDGRSNFQLLCGPCNTCKGDLTDGEFRKKYKLEPARQAKGPPLKVIPRTYFDEITKAAAKKRSQRGNSEDEDAFNPFGWD